jgi:hypothetical protein
MTNEEATAIVGVLADGIDGINMYYMYLVE